IGPAETGKLSEPKSVMRDAGITTSSCYVYDVKTKIYKRIKLREAGDWSQENLSPAAQELANWLETLREKKGDDRSTKVSGH
ncbi:MAG: hypothetical protein ACK5NG_01730, partial [Chthoniobacterales bacterium]